MLRIGGLVTLALLTLSGNSFGQGVNWRHDYSSARKESTTSGKPLLLDFGTSSCSWCLKLEATTFRNPAIVAQLNRHFIPVKIDAEREAKLTAAVQIDSFPTLLLVSSDGKIVARHVGYADTHQMAGFLAKAPTAKAPATTKAPAAVATRITPAPAANPAADLLKLAQAEHDAAHYLRSIEACDRLQMQYPSTPESSAARELAARISMDPNKWQHVTGQLDRELLNVRSQLNERKPESHP